MKITINVNDSDFTEMDSFSLSERFINSEHTQIAQEELSEIKPLNNSKSEEICNVSLQYFKDRVLDTEQFKNIEEQNAEQDNDVVEWLSKVLPENTKIVVSWDDENSVLTNSNIFCKYWDAFCYSSSDDVAIMPLDGDWVLSFSHSEQFEFGSLK